jgi:hypothetical protein
MTVFQSERPMRMASALTNRLSTRACTTLHQSISNRLQKTRSA